MEEPGWRRSVPSYGNWDYYESCPIANYFDAAAPCGNGGGFFDGPSFYPNVLLHRRYAEPADTDLYSISPSILTSAGAKGNAQGRKLKQLMKRAEEGNSHRRIFPPVKTSGNGAAEEKFPKGNCRPKAVDEDLYKIPSELLYRKPIRKRTTACELLSRCLRLNCLP